VLYGTEIENDTAHFWPAQELQHTWLVSAGRWMPSERCSETTDAAVPHTARMVPQKKALRHGQEAQ